MKRTTRYVITPLMLLTGALAFGGCMSSGADQAEAGSDPVLNRSADSSWDDASRSSSGQSSDETSTAEDSASTEGSADPGDASGTETTESSGDAATEPAPERIASESERFMLNRASRQIEQGDYEGADATLGALFSEHGQSPEANRMQAEVRRVLTGRAQPGRDTPQESTARMDEIEAEASKLMEAAIAAQKIADYQTMYDKYDKLLQLIRFAPFKADLETQYLASAEAGRAEAGRKLEAARRDAELAQRDDAVMMRQLEKQSEEMRRREEVVMRLRQAIYELELRNFRNAARQVDRILELDPQFREAEDLRNRIKSEELQTMKRDAYERKVRGYRLALLEIKEASIPDTRIVTLPSGHKAAKIRDRKNHLPDNVRLDPEFVQLQARLDSVVVDVDFNETGLSDVIGFIRQKSSANILIDSSVDPEEYSVTIQLSGVTLSNLLKLTLRRVGGSDTDLVQVFTDGVLMIVAKDESEKLTNEQMVTRVHDIRDLTSSLQLFVGPSLQLRSDDTGGAQYDPPSEDQPEAEDAEGIGDLVQDSFDDETWGSGISAAFGGQLVVTQTPEMHGRIRDFLNELRRIAGLLVALEARFLEIEDDFMSDFGIDFRGLGGPSSVPNQATLVLEDVSSSTEDNAGGAFDNGALGVPPANPSAGIFFNNDDPNGRVNFNRDIRGRFENVFDNALGNRLTNIGGLAMQVAIFKNLTQINAVIRAVQKKGKARTLVSPRISASNTQRANISIINQVAFIRDFEPSTAASAAIANPIIDTILDGIVLEVRPTISNDRRFITMEVRPTIATLLLPIPTFSTTLGPTSAVTIQIPELKVQSAATAVRVPDGGAVVIGGLKRVRDIDRESGTPILSDIPLIGWLFRRKGRSIEQDNLVIVIKAQVVDLNDEERKAGWNG